ncbi:hypothetical protein [Spirochaeta lutea]|uniref:Uncharacterized protein n=1 Tax=Spirochaeta lutea TaxID=1480694 RepID=A0A098R0T9_9SPIO|nr:hypothetical protein [Spirochaeta lutea]KGE73351.1 hypothetical protein DC28_04305 [Spirochaeta lutea]
MRNTLVGLLSCLLLISGAMVWAQEFSEKQDLAIFNLNYYGAPVSNDVPSLSIKSEGKGGSFSLELKGSGSEQTDRIFQQAVGSIDASLREVFIELGRFNVIGLPQRLSSSDVQAFIDGIQEIKESNTEIPEEVRLGQVAFTEAQFNRLVGSFIVVIPSVTQYSQILEEDGDYKTSISTSFSFINVQEYKNFASFTIETTGYDENAFDSMKSAVDSIPGQLEFQIRSVPEFQIKTAIIEVLGGRVYLEFGRNMGLQLGDEYRVLRYRDVAGYNAEDPVALLVIEEIQENFSGAKIIYAKTPLVPGDQLREIPRMGVTLEPYFNVVVASPTEDGFLGFVGLRTAISRGFFGLRPAAGLEFVLGNVGSIRGLMGSLWAGGEYSLYLGRLRPHISAGVGVTGFFDPTGESDPLLSHLYLNLKARVGFLVTDSVEIIAEGGYVHNLSFGSYGSFGGILAGLSVLLK